MGTVRTSAGPGQSRSVPATTEVAKERVESSDGDQG